MSYRLKDKKRAGVFTMPSPSRRREVVRWGVSNRESVKIDHQVGNLRPGETGEFETGVDSLR